MPGKNVPLSLRVSDEDAEFLANFKAPGATTPSEKMRAILAQERRRQESLRDFASCAALVEDLLAPTQSRLRSLQTGKHLRSEFVTRLYDWLPETVAVMMTAVPDSQSDEEALKEFEQDLADRVFALIEETLQLGLTTRTRTVDPNLIADRIEPVQELAELFELRKQRKGKKG